MMEEKEDAGDSVNENEEESKCEDGVSEQVSFSVTSILLSPTQKDILQH